MKKQRPLLLIALLLYALLPGISAWITEPDGAWYRPFALWLGVIVAAYLAQLKSPPHDL